MRLDYLIDSDVWEIRKDFGTLLRERVCPADTLVFYLVMGEGGYLFFMN